MERIGWLEVVGWREEDWVVMVTGSGRRPVMAMEDMGSAAEKEISEKSTGHGSVHYESLAKNCMIVRLNAESQLEF